MEYSRHCRRVSDAGIWSFEGLGVVHCRPTADAVNPALPTRLRNTP